MKYFEAVLSLNFYSIVDKCFWWCIKKWENKLDAHSFVGKPYLRPSYKESNIEEVSDLKKQFKHKKLLDPVDSQEAAKILFW